MRFPFVALSGLTTYLIYRVGFVLFESRERALAAAFIFNIMPLGFLGAGLAMHDNALIFFWTLGLYCMVQFIKTRERTWFYALGACAGAAMLSKYTGVLIVPAVFAFLLRRKEYRAVLRAKEPWIGAIIAAAFTLPILYWNAAHGWASLHHIMYIGSGAPAILRRISDGFGYHVAQFLIVSPVFYFALVLSVGRIASEYRINPPVEFELLLWFGLPVFLFGAMAFKGHVEANWAAMGYISLGIAAVETTARACEQPTGVWRRLCGRIMLWGTVAALAPVTLSLAHGWLGLLPASVERNIAKEDRIIWETRGLSGLGRHVDALRKPDDVIAGDSYQMSAILEFNTPGQPYVRYLAPWNRPTQFDVWEPSLDNLKGRNILFVSPKPLLSSSDVRTTIYENFERVEPLESYKVMYHGEPIREIFVYRGFNFDPASPRPLPRRSLLYTHVQSKK